MMNTSQKMVARRRRGRNVRPRMKRRKGRRKRRGNAMIARKKVISFKMMTKNIIPVHLPSEVEREEKSSKKKKRNNLLPVSISSFLLGTIFQNSYPCSNKVAQIKE